MPSAPQHLRDRWVSNDAATAYLKGRGYALSNTWEWAVPDGQVPTEADDSAVDYLIMEWDFGGYMNDPRAKEPV